MGDSIWAHRWQDEPLDWWGEAVDDRLRHQIAAGIGIGLAILSCSLPVLVPAMPREMAWAGVGIGCLFLAWGVWPLFPAWPWAVGRYGMIPLRRAVGRIYGATRSSQFAAFYSGFGSNEPQVVRGYLGELIDLGIPIYGKTPPAAEWLPVSFDPAHEDLLNMSQIVPHHQSPKYIELSLRHSDIKEAIKKINAAD